MAFDPNDPSYDPSPGLPPGLERSATGRLRAPGLAVGMRETAKMWRELSKTIKRKRNIEALKGVFTAMGKITTAGAKEIARTFELTRSLMGMPGRTATQGLDMLSSQLVAPITGAVSQAIGQAMGALNQVIGPALQQIGASIGGFIRQQPIGAGIGGAIGGIATAITGIPGLGIAGGLIGAGIEALVKMPGDEPPPGDIDPINFQAAVSQARGWGWSWQDIIDNFNARGRFQDILASLGITTGEDLNNYMNPGMGGAGGGDPGMGGAGGGDPGLRTHGGDVFIGGGSVFDSQVAIDLLANIHATNQQIHRQQVWGGL